MPALTYGADPEGRTGAVTAGPSTVLATGVTYNAAGQVTGLQLGPVDNDSDAWSCDPATGRITG